MPHLTHRPILWAEFVGIRVHVSLQHIRAVTDSNAGESYLMSKSKSFPDGPSDGVTHRVPA